MNNIEFTSKAKNIYKNYNTKYVLGTFMNKKENNKLCTDCSGLIKGILWGYPCNGKYASNGLPDINADTLISKCSGVSTNFTNIEVGEVVWVKGHIGIYIGDGKVIESTSKWGSKVQMTALGNKGTIKGLNTRTWIKHGKLPYISYSNKYLKTNYKGTSFVDGLKSINVDSSFSNRKKLAAINGITNYKGTLEQNIKLLNLLKQGKLKKA